MIIKTIIIHVGIKVRANMLSPFYLKGGYIVDTYR